MFNQKPYKSAVTATPETLRRQEPFIQIEAELTGDRLEAIADALMKLTTLYTSFKEELMSKQKQGKFMVTSVSNPAGIGPTDSNYPA